jgi:signal transduction histidine kinase
LNRAKSSDSPVTVNDIQLSDLYHQLSHDIGNPLTAIISYSSILEQAEHFAISLDKVGSYASNITRETWRISRLMEKFLLLISKKVVISPFPVSELKQRIDARYRSRYELHDLEIRYCGFDTEIRIPADIDQCCSIICEIASNAMSAQKHLEGVQTPALSISFSTEDEFLLIEVKNSSPVHTKPLSVLFTPGEREFSTEREGLGIGLSAISCAMKRWNGVLEIQEVLDNTGGHTVAEFNTRLLFPKI